VADHSSAHEKNGVCSTDTPSDRTSRWFGAHPSSQAVEWKDSMNLLDAHIERKILTSSMKRQVLFSFSALSIVQEFTQISESTAQDLKAGIIRGELKGGQRLRSRRCLRKTG